MGIMVFQDRTDAGCWLAGELTQYATCPEVLVLGVVPGGIPVAFEVARVLHAPLDVILVRPLRVPGEQEISLGAVSSSGMRQLNQEVIDTLGVSEQVIKGFMAKEQQELAHCERLYRANRSVLAVQDRTVILVDDGMVTGATMQVAVALLRQEHPARIIVAVPVASSSACKKLRTVADAVVCLRVPERFYSLGCWYRHFPAVTDEEICTLLKRAKPIPPNPQL